MIYLSPWQLSKIRYIYPFFTRTIQGMKEQFAKHLQNNHPFPISYLETFAKNLVLNVPT